MTSDRSFDSESYWQERLTNTYDLDGVGFTGLSRSYNQYLYRIRRFNFRRIVGKYDLEPSLSVLDIGSGTGFYVNLRREIGVEEIVGIDITEVAVERLRQQYPQQTFLKQDIRNPISGKYKRKFGAVSAMDVLFHIVDDEEYMKALSNIHDLLVPGGLLFYTDNFLHSEPFQSGHIAHRSIDDISGSLQEVGFSIEYRSPVFMIMNEPVDDPSRLSRRLWKEIYRVASHSEWGGIWVVRSFFLSK
jgi:SAM-dependent methyltransferase